MTLGCHHCDKELYDSSSLLRHTKSKHPDTISGIRKSTSTHRCFSCEKSFTRAESLKRHALKHTGYSTECFLCAKAVRHDDLKHHEPICVERHLRKLKASANLDSSTGLAIGQGPLQFQWDPNTAESLPTRVGDHDFQFIRGRTKDIAVAAQDFRKLVLHAIGARDFQMCEATCATASALGISFKNMAKRPVLGPSHVLALHDHDNCFEFLELILCGEADLGTKFGTGRFRLVTNSSARLLGEPSGLHLACYQGFVEVTQSLILSGAYLDVVDGGGGTPLTLAVAEGHVDTVNLLLSKGANPDKGWPLAECINAALGNYKKPEMARIATALVRGGAGISVANVEENTVLHMAAYCADAELLRSIIATNPPDQLFLAASDSGVTALHLAVEYFSEAIPLLLNACPEAANAIDGFNGQTPLAQAIEMHNDLAVQSFLDHRDRHSKRTLDNALCTAAQFGRESYIRALIKVGAVLDNEMVKERLVDLGDCPAIDKRTIEPLLDEGTRADFLSKDSIDRFLEVWIDIELWDRGLERLGNRKPWVEMLRQQYLDHGELPSATMLDTV
ncbi:hypothetical protein Q7P37_002759 [Cladosporium fusiforme]